MSPSTCSLVCCNCLYFSVLNLWLAGYEERADRTPGAQLSQHIGAWFISAPNFSLAHTVLGLRAGGAGWDGGEVRRKVVPCHSQSHKSCFLLHIQHTLLLSASTTAYRIIRRTDTFLVNLKPTVWQKKGFTQTFAWMYYFKQKSKSWISIIIITWLSVESTSSLNYPQCHSTSCW